MTATDHEVRLYPGVAKYCTARSSAKCAGTWTGHTFTAPTADQAPVPGICSACADQHIRETRAISSGPRMAIATKAHSTADQDQPFTAPGRHLRRA